MKFSLLLASALAAHAFAGTTAAASLAAKFQAPVTIDLALTRDSDLKSTPITGGQSITSKFITVRVTARDFLQKLIDEGEIMGPLAGWNLVARSTSDDAPVLGHRLFAVKTGQPDYALDTGETPVLNFSQPQTLSAVDIRSISEKIVSGHDSRKFTVTGVFDAPIAPLPLSGLGETKLVYRPFSLGSTSASIPVPARIDLALTGGFSLEGPGGVEIYTVRGAIIIGSHRVTKLQSVAAD